MTDQDPEDPELEEILGSCQDPASVPPDGEDPRCPAHGDPVVEVVNRGSGPMTVFECGCEMPL